MSTANPNHQVLICCTYILVEFIPTKLKRGIASTSHSVISAHADECQLLLPQASKLVKGILIDKGPVII